MKITKIENFIMQSILTLLSIVFLFASFQKIIGVEQMLKNMTVLNYSMLTTRLIGIIEVVMIIGIWIKKYRNLSLSVLILILAGASGSHQTAKHVILSTTVIPFLLSSLAALAIFLNDKKAFMQFFFNLKIDSFGK